MENAKKECFGQLNKVFPMDGSGLREVSAHCFECPDKTECLKSALRTEEGLDLREEIIERSPAESGIVGRIKRWSERKSLSRLRKEKNEK